MPAQMPSRPSIFETTLPLLDRYRVSESVFAKIQGDITPLIDKGPPAGNRCYNSSSGKVDVSIKLAMTLRYLAGGSYLDIHTEVGVSRSFFYKCIWEVVEAIVKVYPLEFPLPKEGDDVASTRAKMDELERIAAGYKARSSMGVLDSCVGALDGQCVDSSAFDLVNSFPSCFHQGSSLKSSNLSFLCPTQCGTCVASTSSLSTFKPSATATASTRGGASQCLGRAATASRYATLTSARPYSARACQLLSTSSVTPGMRARTGY